MIVVRNRSDSRFLYEHYSLVYITRIRYASMYSNYIIDLTYCQFSPASETSFSGNGCTHTCWTLIVLHLCNNQAQENNSDSLLKHLLSKVQFHGHRQYSLSITISGNVATITIYYYFICNRLLTQISHDT